MQHHNTDDSFLQGSTLCGSEQHQELQLTVVDELAQGSSTKKFYMSLKIILIM
jgi:hypothetical protein